jgi:hypothetical protein
MRPVTPDIPQLVEDPGPCRDPDPFIFQRDEEGRGWMTPEYSVPSEPSIVYTPEGMVQIHHRNR